MTAETIKGLKNPLKDHKISQTNTAEFKHHVQKNSAQFLHNKMYAFGLLAVWREPIIYTCLIYFFIFSVLLKEQTLLLLVVSYSVIVQC